MRSLVMSTSPLPSLEERVPLSSVSRSRRRSVRGLQPKAQTNNSTQTAKLSTVTACGEEENTALSNNNDTNVALLDACLLQEKTPVLSTRKRRPNAPSSSTTLSTPLSVQTRSQKKKRQQQMQQQQQEEEHKSNGSSETTLLPMDPLVVSTPSQVQPQPKPKKQPSSSKSCRNSMHVPSPSLSTAVNGTTGLFPLQPSMDRFTLPTCEEETTVESGEPNAEPPQVKEDDPFVAMSSETMKTATAAAETQSINNNKGLKPAPKQRKRSASSSAGNRRKSLRLLPTKAVVEKKDNETSPPAPPVLEAKATATFAEEKQGEHPTTTTSREAAFVEHDKDDESSRGLLCLPEEEQSISVSTRRRRATMVVRPLSGNGRLNSLLETEDSLSPASTTRDGAFVNGSVPNHTFNMVKKLNRSGSILRNSSYSRAAGSSEANVVGINVDKNREVGLKSGPWSAELVANRAKRMFADVLENDKPCLSSLIFSCLGLSGEEAAEEQIIDGSGTLNDSALEKILPFLKYLVYTEVVSLKGGEEAQPNSVHFCSYDSSSSLPPVDRVQGSDMNKGETIEALKQVKQEIDALLNDVSAKDEIKVSLTSIVDFLSRDGEKCYQPCARCMGPDYPIKRVEKAAKFYQREMETLLSRLDGGESFLFVEKRFAEFVGQSIRFHIRWLLRPAPPRLSPSDATYDTWSECYSQVTKVISMEARVGNEEADNDSIAAFFTKALDLVCEYFGLSHFLDASFDSPSSVPQSFFRRADSQNLIKHPFSVNQADLGEVLRDIDDAAKIVSVGNACSFLHDLLSLEPVQKEIERQGGWSWVETYATYSWMFNLWKIHPEDEHLVALVDFNAFYQRLLMICNALKMPTAVAKAEIAAFRKKCRLRTRGKQLGRQMLFDCLEEHAGQANFFPKVSVQSLEGGGRQLS